ncbi:hypothetical protein JXA88_05495 [Candidatus Fermentibacteria bacterium]|nr:hypothetical protein [Candidatus Fermentibacteria bacterium]
MKQRWVAPGVPPGGVARIDYGVCGTVGAPGDATVNWTYLVMAVSADERKLVRSNRIGEFDFDIP